MKIIVGEPLANSNNTAYQTLDIIRKSARISTLADTTLTTHGKPVFVPDWGGKCFLKFGFHAAHFKFYGKA